ncbi:MAG: ABC transporter ATP-binding protein [Chloroflexota bacterium]
MKEQWQTIQRVLQYYPRVLSLVWQANQLYASLVIGLTIISALVTPVQIWLVKVVIDRVAEVVSRTETAATVEWFPLILPVIAFALTLVAGDISRSIMQAIREILGTQAELHAKSMILEKAATLDIAFFESPAFYDQLENAQRDTWRMRNLPWILIDTTGQTISLVATFALLARIHPLLIPLLLLTSIPKLIAQAQHANNMFAIWTARAPAQRMVYYLSDLLSERDSVKEVRLFGLQRAFIERFREFSRQFVAENREAVFRHERKNIIAVLVSICGTGLVWAYTIRQAALARITLGDLALVFQAAQQIRDGLSGLFHTLGVFYEHSLFVGNLYQFLELSPSAVNGALTQTENQKTTSKLLSSSSPYSLEFRNVSFHYPGAKEDVLHNLSFTIQPKSTIAIVGENGAGKTTLIKLLTRFYDPTDGVILLNGVDMRNYDPAELRKLFGVIFQDFVRYNLTAQENIGFGQLELAEDLERVMQAADKGGAVPVVEKLENGYATMLGRTFEDSVDLSGGEWQKLALSRAFMRDAQFLILDEPTAALDALAEYEVYNRFAELTEGKTTIFISHRFSTVRMAQQILVLDDGQLIEEGSHSDLMTLGGQYAKMFNSQAERYL